MDLNSLSGGMKSMKKFIVQAKQVEKIDPKVAHMCRMYAAQEGLNVQGRTAADNAFIISLLDWLENNNSVAGMSPDERRAHLESFALAVFDTADDQDRAGAATLDTAKCFYSAAILLEASLQFGPHSPDVEQKATYALWKVADIRRAIKEGRQPLPGGPGDQIRADAEAERELGASGSFGGSAGGAAGGAGSAPAAEVYDEDALAAAFSSLPSPGGNKPSAGSRSSLSSAPAPKASGSSLSSSSGGLGSSSSSGGLGSSSGGLGTGGAPRMTPSPRGSASGFNAPPSYSPAAAAAGGAAGGAGGYGSSLSAPSHPQQQQHHQYQQQQPQQQQQRGASPAAPAPAPAPAHAPAPAPAPARAPYIPPSPLPHAPPLPAVASARQGTRASATDPLVIAPNPASASRAAACKDADRLSRHVSSALNFDDVPTAIAKLKDALALLLPYEFETPQY